MVSSCVAVPAAGDVDYGIPSDRYTVHHPPAEFYLFMERMVLITYIEVPPIVEALDSQSKKACNQMMQMVCDVGSEMHCDNGFDLLSCTGTALIFIRKGIFKYFYQKKLVRLYEAGDCLPNFDHIAAPDCRCIGEFGADIVLFSPEEIGQIIASSTAFTSLFLQLISIQSKLMQILCALYVNDEAYPGCSLKSYNPGEFIITEGTPALEIYLMVQGTACVTVMGTDVGLVESGEIFGEISFFTSGIRSATVTAKTECLVQVMSKNDFLALIKLKPSINLGISKTLSERLILTNRKIAEK